MKRLCHGHGVPERIRGYPKKGERMIALVLFLLLVAVLFGLGLAVKALFWVAFVMLAVWVVGFLVRPAGGRWYYW